MPESTIELDTPLLLLAMPQVLDPFFHKSVVLLIQHQEEGSYGLIVNRPTPIPVAEILEGLEIAWNGSQESLAYFGGPVEPQVGTVVFQQDDEVFQQDGFQQDEPLSQEHAFSHDHDAGQTPITSELAEEIYPGAVITQHLGDLAGLAEKPPGSFRLFLGHAGWGDGQLAQEILRNDWLTAPVSHDLVFSKDPEAAWEAALETVGVDPSQLPSWTPDNEDGSAN